jgi:hypothetical protein
MTTALPYREFLAAKAHVVPASGLVAGELHESLFGFQRAIVQWAVRRGRAAVFAGTGLGKTRMQIEWLRSMVPLGSAGLIVAPLAVADQTIEEAERLGGSVRFAEEQPAEPGLWITNYEKLHKFDPSRWAAVALDESSILKSVDGKTRTRLLREWTVVPYRTCYTATPAPNDIAELANHAEFLGVMTRPEMLATFFVHEDGADWRLKGHAADAFYRWMATWSVYVRRPSDLDFSDEGFELPPLTIAEERVAVDFQPDDGLLFPELAGGFRGRHAARRGSLEGRVEAAARIIREKPGQWLVWCGLNDEGRLLAQALGEECPDVALVEGADDPLAKIARERAWRAGTVRTLISKPSIFGFGMNWQHCRQMLFLGLGDSWEQYFQAIRRCWRFGQTQPVDVVIVTSEAEARVVENVWRKERDSERIAEGVVEHMREFEAAAVLEHGNGSPAYREDVAEGDGWRLLLGDCVPRLAEVASGSLGLSVHSPPFSELYVYSASDRDMGNSRNYDQFFEHYGYVARELLRATMPGRRAAVHVQQVAMKKAVDGVIGWRDFRADVVRTYVEAGWVYDGEVVIDKDPQAQAIRTKSKQLMFVQKERDSAWLRPAMADYILCFRKPGENPEPVHPDVTNDEWILWARPIWYGIRESETLQAAAAREEADEKHIAPLQLGTVERCVRLWTNPGDLIGDPCAGIGTTGVVALRHGRRFVGVELKESYWKLAARHLREARSQLSLLEDAPA